MSWSSKDNWGGKDTRLWKRLVSICFKQQVSTFICTCKHTWKFVLFVRQLKKKSYYINIQIMHYESTSITSFQSKTSIHSIVYSADPSILQFSIFLSHYFLQFCSVLPSHFFFYFNSTNQLSFGYFSNCFPWHSFHPCFFHLFAQYFSLSHLSTCLSVLWFFC